MSKPCENCGCDLKVCKDCDLYTGKYFKAELQAELEKIKAKIEDMGWDIYKTERKVPKEYVEKERIYEILDKEIAELKGESNDL